MDLLRFFLNLHILLKYRLQTRFVSLLLLCLQTIYSSSRKCSSFRFRFHFLLFSPQNFYLFIYGGEFSCWISSPEAKEIIVQWWSSPARTRTDLDVVGWTLDPGKARKLTATHWLMEVENPPVARIEQFWRMFNFSACRSRADPPDGQQCCAALQTRLAPPAAKESQKPPQNHLSYFPSALWIINRLRLLIVYDFSFSDFFCKTIFYFTF